MVRLVRLGHVLPNAPEFLLVAAKSSSVVFPLLVVLVLLTYLWSVFGVVGFGGGIYLAGLFGDGAPYETENRHQGFYGVAQGMQTMLGVATTPGSNGWVTLMRKYEDATAPRWRWAVVAFFGSYALLTRFLLVQFFMITLLFKYKAHSSEKVRCGAGGGVRGAREGGEYVVLCRGVCGRFSRPTARPLLLGTSWESVASGRAHPPACRRNCATVVNSADCLCNASLEAACLPAAGGLLCPQV